MTRIKHGMWGLALAGVLTGICGCGQGGGGTGSDAAAKGAARLTATVTSDGAAAKQTAATELAPLDVAAVDEHGNKVDEALGITGSFELALPWGHDYVLVFADAQGLLGAMVYGEREQSRFSVEPGVLSLDLGQIVINQAKRYVKLKDPRSLEHGDQQGDEDGENPGQPGTGDAVAGAQLWQTYCAGCHTARPDDASATEIAEVLSEGDGGAMPAFPDLVANAADIAAYWNGQVAPNPDSDGDGIPDAVDQCPNVAGNGPDGCPLPPPPADADGDGVPDVADACPNTAAATPDGCPAAPPSRPAVLDTTCVGCHADFSARVGCGNAKWTRHASGFVSAAVFDEVSTWATGGVCP